MESFQMQVGKKTVFGRFATYMMNFEFIKNMVLNNVIFRPSKTKSIILFLTQI